MFSKIIALFVLTVFTILAAAAPWDSGSSVSCSTGSAECCNQVGTASSLGLDSILGNLLGSINPATTLGLGCTPITVVGAGGGANCAQQPVCCTGQNIGLINVDCNPISL